MKGNRKPPTGMTTTAAAVALPVILALLLLLLTRPPLLVLALSLPKTSGGASAAPTLADRSPSWADLRARVTSATPTGARLSRESELRSAGVGPPHVDARLRLFDAPSEDDVRVTLYRDSAAWCPYCQKVWIALEEMGVPYRVETVPLNAYGDKPAWFTRLVDGGKLPAIKLDSTVVTESLDIIRLLDETFFPDHHQSRGGMVPIAGSDEAEMAEELLKLERELQSDWFSLVFYPVEGEALTKARANLLDTLGRVDDALSRTPGPWFLGGDSPSVVDVQYVTHFERIIASVLYWKGIDIRGNTGGAGKFPNLDAWLEAFESRSSYLATKSDLFTLVMAIPSQNGPGYSIKEARGAASRICGLDGAWTLAALDDDDDDDEVTCRHRHEAAFVLTSNHEAIAEFAARGAGEPGRPSFHAELADPYAEPNYGYVQPVDVCLRHVTAALLDGVDGATDEGGGEAAADGIAAQDLAGQAGDGTLREGWYEYNDDDGHRYWWNEETGEATWMAPPTMQLDTCLMYLRDRIGVPRDGLTEGAAMQLRAHLNWAVDLLNRSPTR